VITRAGGGEATSRFITGLPDENGVKRTEAQREDQGLHYNSLASDKNGRHMEPFIIDIEADAVQEKHPHEGEEFIYCMAGAVNIDYGAMNTVLHPGDSIYYDCIVPHSVLAAEGKPARILAVIYTPV
jgi:quercetin dioxygenase-like cupin family protein